MPAGGAPTKSAEAELQQPSPPAQGRKLHQKLLRGDGSSHVTGGSTLSLHVPKPGEINTPGACLQHLCDLWAQGASAGFLLVRSLRHEGCRLVSVHGRQTRPRTLRRQGDVFVRSFEPCRMFLATSVYTYMKPYSYSPNHKKKPGAFAAALKTSSLPDWHHVVSVHLLPRTCCLGYAGQGCKALRHIPCCSPSLQQRDPEVLQSFSNTCQSRISDQATVLL